MQTQRILHALEYVLRMAQSEQRQWASNGVKEFVMNQLRQTLLIRTIQNFRK